MTLLELLHRRRSVRQFLDKEVEQSKIDAIIAGALTAPSSKNTRSTRFAIVQQKQTLVAISKMRDFGSSFLEHTPAAIIVMGDELATDLWRENCAISATIMQLTAESLGLSSCWVHVCGRPQQRQNPDAGDAETYLKTLLPAIVSYRIHCIIALGYPEIEPKPHSPHDYSDKIVKL